MKYYFLLIAILKADLRYNNNINIIYNDTDDVVTLQTTQPTSGGAVTVVSSCCANCVNLPAPSIGGPIYRFLGMPAMRTRWMAGAAAHESG